jgi:hypothetical protein
MVHAQATWMYRAANAAYLPGNNAASAARYLAHMTRARDAALAEEDSNSVSLDYMLNAGIVHAALNTETWDWHSRAQSFVWDWVCSGDVEYTTFGRAFVTAAPMLGDTVLAAGLAQMYALKTGTSKVRHYNATK